MVRLIEPHSEADPAAILFQGLVAFGSVAGRSAYFVTDGAQQHLNENLLINGPTASGRKGTGWAQVHRVYREVDPQWSREQQASGISSGEGLIHRVRDAGPGKDDAGVQDKRLLAIEPEFASVLKVIRREGNTASAIMRQAWDSGILRTMTRASPLSATDAHISIIGHITPSELTQLLHQTDAANGLLNRFLLIASRRSKFLPDGGAPAASDVEWMARQVRDMLAIARNTGRMERSAPARELWHDVYGTLVERPGGLLGSATSRAAPHVVRLSCLYALLDGSRTVDRSHLESALAAWDFVERCTRFFLGDALGDPIADAILAALRASTHGLTRTEISKLSANHWTADDIGAALQKLATEGLAVAEKAPTKGRSAERWTTVRGAEKAKDAENGALTSLSYHSSQSAEVITGSGERPHGPSSAKEAGNAEEASRSRSEVAA
jgi:hypothetical protein